MMKEDGEYPNYRLDGRVAMVTGAGQGLGNWIALGLAHAGADVIVADIVGENAEKTALQIEEMGRKAFALRLDVGDVQSAAGGMSKGREALGGLDILVNNAGINVHKQALDITPEEFDRIVRVNERGVYFCSQTAAQLMIPQGKGKIINIASAAAFLVRSGIPNSVYAMTKAGIVMLTKALAEEWAKYKINVNAVAPGYFATPLVADRLKDATSSKSILGSTPLNRVGESTDIMGSVVFLASEASDYITGQTICVDGGRTVL